MNPSLILAAGGGINPESHIERHGLFGLSWFNNHMLMCFVTVVVGYLLLTTVAKAMAPRPEEGAKGYVTRSRFGGFFELILVYLRDESIKPLLHDKTDKYIGILWSIFFFVLVGNLLGMLPISPLLGLIYKPLGHTGGTFTGNWNFTIGLAAIACLVWLYAGLKEGGMGYICLLYTSPSPRDA